MNRFPSNVLAMLLSLVTGVAVAQAFPDRPIHLIVPYPPGGGTDTLARQIANGMGEALGKTVIVENRGGANGRIAGEAVAHAAADGYTLLVVDNAFASNPSLFKDNPLNPIKDFTPISLTGTAPLVLVIGASVPANSLKDLITLAKASPGKLTYASAGNGNTTHLSPEMMKLSSGVSIQQIPYKGSGPAVTDLVGGQVTMMFTGISAVKQFIDTKQLKALAVTGTKRSTLLPNVPTMAEAGFPLPDLDLGSWWGIVGPAGIPKEVVAKLNEAIKNATDSPGIREKLQAQNIDPRSDSPQEFAKLINDETGKYADLVKRAKIETN